MVNEDIFIPNRRFTPVVHQDARYVEMFFSPDRAMLLSAPSSAPTSSALFSRYVSKMNAFNDFT